jgi:hypothetical protein
MFNEITPLNTEYENLVIEPLKIQSETSSVKTKVSEILIHRGRISKVLAMAAVVCTAVVGAEAMHPAVAEASCCNANAQAAFDFFEEEGYTATQSAAWVGNLAQESSVTPTEVQPNGVGHGIAQWSEPGRWDNLVTYASNENQSDYSLNLQLNFIDLELSGPYSSVAKEVKATSNLTTATEDICNDYEIAGTCGADNRVTYAQEALSDYGSMQQPSTESLQAPSAVSDTVGGTGRNVFYVGGNSEIWDWYVSNGSWV